MWHPVADSWGQGWGYCNARVLQSNRNPITALTVPATTYAYALLRLRTLL